jgi:hypothetical protein
MHTKKQKKLIQKYIVAPRVRTQSNCVTVQSPTTNLKLVGYLSKASQTLWQTFLQEY